MSSAELTDRKFVGMVDCTPTWESILSTLRLLAESDSDQAREVAWIEIAKMARCADQFNALATQ